MMRIWMATAAGLGACSAFMTGCATVMTPQQLQQRRGTGVKKTIAAPAGDVLDLFVDQMRKANYSVAREEDAAYATHSAGVSGAVFVAPSAEPARTDAEVVFASSLLSAAQLRSTENGVMDAIATQAELKQYKASGAPQAQSVARPSSEAAAPPARRASSDVDTFGRRLKERPDDIALIVGIDAYQNVPSAEFAGRDAAAMKDYLIGLGVPEENVIFLTGAKATKTGISKYLEEWLPRNATPDSRVYFYYSGHGAPDPSTGASYLIPWDGDPQFLETSAYSVPRLYEKLQSLKAKQVVVMLDSCFSGAGGRSVIAKGARPLVNVSAPSVPVGSKLSVMTAASSEQITGALEDQGHGMFTYYLLKGLKGDADADRDGHVTLGELQGYVKKGVERAARRQNREQTPQLQSSHAELELY